ncbi:MAG: hypothetical protein GY776_02185 [Alteromonas sp.]|nr:hypothetical protein [Alteromonas sp.]
MAYEQHDHVHTFNTNDAAVMGMVEQWDAMRRQSPEASQLLLAYTRHEVQQLNEQARALRQTHGELGPDHTMETSRGCRTFAEQDRLYFLRNDPRELGVKNGTLGTIEKIDGDQLTVRLDHGDREPARQINFSLKDYLDIDHGYAATVYKAQGVTVDHSHVLASKYFDRHSTYVAMSRHREGADLYMSREDFPSVGVLTKTLQRERSKDVTLDYGLDRPPVPESAHRSPPCANRWHKASVKRCLPWTSLRGQRLFQPSGTRGWRPSKHVLNLNTPNNPLSCRVPYCRPKNKKLWPLSIVTMRCKPRRNTVKGWFSGSINGR